MIDREELERLHEAAIPGPWRAEKIKGHDDFTQILHTKKDGKIGCVSADINDADGELTAHLRNAVPDILKLMDERGTLAAENAALAEKVEKLEGALRLFKGAAYPVCTSIDSRGYAWSEAYLDQALAALNEEG